MLRPLLALFVLSLFVASEGIHNLSSWFLSLSKVWSLHRLFPRIWTRVLSLWSALPTAREFRLTETVGLLGFTHFKLNGDTILHCHPNFRGQGKWFEWVMVRYEEDTEGSGTTVKEHPAQILAFVRDLGNLEQRIKMVICWAGDKVKGTVATGLFDRYSFDHNDDNPMYEIQPVESVSQVLFAAAAGDDKIVVATECRTWGEKFLPQTTYVGHTDTP